jgi:hypothetical protein
VLLFLVLARAAGFLAAVAFATLPVCRLGARRDHFRPAARAFPVLGFNVVCGEARASLPWASWDLGFFVFFFVASVLMWL